MAITSADAKALWNADVIPCGTTPENPNWYAKNAIAHIVKQLRMLIETVERLEAKVDALDVEPVPEPTPEPVPEPTPEPVPEPTPEPVPQPTPETTLDTWITFFASYDNDPPGTTEIAYPIIHSGAGGIGTYADPITFACDPRLIPKGTRIYVPRFRKYFIMEDLCASARRAYPRPWIDLYVGDTTDSRVIAYEEALTRDETDLDTIIVNPDWTHLVDAHPLWSNAGGYMVQY